MGLFSFFRKKKNTSCIQDMKHFSFAPWHQYDVLLATMGYGWETMIEWGDYLLEADLYDIGQVTAGDLGQKETSITESFLASGGKCRTTAELATEQAVLSLAGSSKTLQAPVKIVWFNQTRILRFFTYVGDETLMRKYIETVIRRNFGTDEAMK